MTSGKVIRLKKNSNISNSINISNNSDYSSK